MKIRLILLIFLSLMFLSSFSSLPNISISPYIVDASFSEIYGGDEFIVDMNNISRNSSGLIFRERFDYLNKAIWHPISGSWKTVGYLYTDGLQDEWSIILLNISLGYGIYEFKIYSRENVMIGGSMVSKNISSEPLRDKDNAFSIIASIGSCFFYNPPPESISDIVPPKDQWIIFRIKYYRDLFNKSRYCAYTYIIDNWRTIVKNQLTLDNGGLLRFLTYGLGEARFDELLVYRSTSIKFYGLVEGAVIQLYDENGNLAISCMANSSIVEIDLAKYLFPLHNWRIKVIFPPYIQYSFNGNMFYDGINSTIHISDRRSLLAIYSGEINISGPYNISWIIPRDASIINLTIASDGERHIYLNYDTIPLNFFKKIVFKNIDSSGELYLYTYLPNIVKKLDIYDVDRDIHNPLDVNPGDLLDIKIYVRSNLTQLKNADMIVKVLNKSNDSLIDEIMAKTDVNGIGNIRINAPLYSFKLKIYVNYTSRYIRLIGFNETSFKIKSFIYLEGPQSIPPLKSFKIYVHLFTSTYDICGREIILQKWSNNGWINITSGVTNCSGIAEINMALEETGTHDFRAIFIGDDQYSSAVSSIISIHVLKKVLLNLSGPSNYPRGRMFTLNVYLSSNHSPVSNKLVRLYRSIDLTNWTMVGENTTDLNGYTCFKVIENNSGLYYYRAIFDGDDEYSRAESNIIIINIVSTPTYVKLISPLYTNVTISFVLKARLTDDLDNPIMGREILFMKKIGDTWIKIGRNITDENGYAYIYLYENSTGEYYYRAVFEGDSLYGRSISKERAISIYRLSIRIKAFIDKPKIYVDERFRITALLSYVNNTVLRNMPVEFYGVEDKLIGVSYTNDSGHASATYVISSPGNFTLKIVFAGDSFRDKCVVRINVSIYRIPTFLVLSGPIQSMEDEVFVLKCILKDIFGKNISGREIVFERKVGDEWKVIGINISINGLAQLNVVENEMGQYSYRAIFRGDYKYEKSISNEINVSINIGFKKLLFLILLLIVLIIVLFGIIVWRRRSHESTKS